MTASKIYLKLKNYFDKNEIYYKPYKKEKVLRLSASLGASAKDEQAYILIHIACEDFFVSINACLEQSADEKSCAKVMEYLTRVNYTLKNGCFCIDLRDGEISFNSSLNCIDRETLSDDLISIFLSTPHVMFNHYYAGLMDVMSGKKTPEEAVSELYDNDNDEGCFCGCGH